MSANVSLTLPITPEFLAMTPEMQARLQAQWLAFLHQQHKQQQQQQHSVPSDITLYPALGGSPYSGDQDNIVPSLIILQ